MGGCDKTRRSRIIAAHAMTDRPNLLRCRMKSGLNSSSQEGLFDPRKVSSWWGNLPSNMRYDERNASVQKIGSRVGYDFDVR